VVSGRVCQTLYPTMGVDMKKLYGKLRLFFGCFISFECGNDSDSLNSRYFLNGLDFFDSLGYFSSLDSLYALATLDFLNSLDSVDSAFLRLFGLFDFLHIQYFLSSRFLKGSEFTELVHY
jgi:hypothetical protein